MTRVAVLPVAAISFCCVGLVTAFVGLREVVGTGSTAKLWLVLFVAAGIAALVLLRTARDRGGRVRLGVGWAVLGAVVAGVAIGRTPAPGPGVPIGSGWAVLVAGGAGVLAGGVVLALSPRVRLLGNRVFVCLVIVVVGAIQACGYLGALGWTNGQNVRLSVADDTPLPVRESALDGRVQWSSKIVGEQIASAGGILTTLANGLQMLDPATGVARWTYRRADIGAVMDPVASGDGTLVAAIGVQPSPNPKPQVPLSQRLLVLDAVTGAVVTDSPLDPRAQGTLSTLGSAGAYFSGGPDNIRNVQISAVAITGPQAGRQEWVYYPKDTCDIDAVSALGSEVALSTTCGTVAMLNPNGTPRWEFHSPAGGAQIWPLAGSPSGTVQVVTEPAPTSDPTGLGVSAPSGVVSLDAHTGAVRSPEDTLPKAPFAPDSPDSATGALTMIWAGDTAVLVYDLEHSGQTWIVGYRANASPRTWSTLVPGPPDLANPYVAATPDGRILLPTQNIDVTDQRAYPQVTVVNGRDGRIGPSVAVDGTHGVPDSTGYFGPPHVLPTPGGVVLAIPGEPLGQPSVPTQLVIGLH